MKRSRHFLSILIFISLILCSCSNHEMPDFNADSAWNYLVMQCELGPRVPGSDAHAGAVDLIRGELEKNGWDVELQPFTLADPYGDGELHLINIIARLKPKLKKRVLLAAHYDTRPWADKEEQDSLKLKPIPGANDGASGVAVLLELARVIKNHPPAELGVDLVFFDGEDYGKSGDIDNYLLGSKYFASNLYLQPGGYHPRCAILLDMVGAKDAKILQELNSIVNAPKLTKEIFARAERLNLGMFKARKGKAVYDDHVPLLRAGIKAVNLIDIDYKYWHTLADTPEKCSKDSLSQTGRLLIDFLYNSPF